MCSNSSKHLKQRITTHWGERIIKQATKLHLNLAKRRLSHSAFYNAATIKYFLVVLRLTVEEYVCTNIWAE